MKITVKTTQQKIFQVDVEGPETIADLKNKIQQSQGHPVASQKIIYSGKILTDDKTVESCAFKEKDFLVLMVSKPKPTPAASTSTPTPGAVVAAPAPPPQPQAAPAPEAAPVVESTPQPIDTTPSAPPAAFGDPSTFLSGPGLQDAINGMIEMGFPRDQVLRAMRASFNNADRAVEYLMTGIPAHLDAEEPRAPAAAAAPTPQAPAAQAAAPPSNQTQPSNQPQNLFQLAQQQQQQGGAGGAGAGAGPGGQINLEALRNNPQIQQLREQMAQNPQLIGPLIQQLASQNPAIAQIIAQNPEALLQLLGIELGEGEGGEGEEGIPPGAHVVSVTEEERAAIQRLEALGFPRQAVLEAYFACDKNEELAANYLFESGFDD